MNWTRTEVAALLKEKGVRPNRRRGQNFLVDPNLLKAIVREAAIRKTDGVIEIGTGIGSLTFHLAEKAGHAWSFEIDRKLQQVSSELLRDVHYLTLIRGDGADFERFVDPRYCKKLKVVSNLPYSDWHRLFIKLLSTKLPIEHYTLLIQKDAFDRLRAKPRTKEYGADSVLVQTFCTMKKLRNVGRKVFLPMPRVDSVLIRIVRREVGDLEPLYRMLKALFSQRRKKLRKWMEKHDFTDDDLARYGEKRVDELGPEVVSGLAMGALARP